jgi:hypothetical protein
MKKLFISDVTSVCGFLCPRALRRNDDERNGVGKIYRRERGMSDESHASTNLSVDVNCRIFPLSPRFSNKIVYVPKTGHS